MTVWETGIIILLFWYDFWNIFYSVTMILDWQYLREKSCSYILTSCRYNLQHHYMVLELKGRESQTCEIFHSRLPKTFMDCPFCLYYDSGPNLPCVMGYGRYVGGGLYGGIFDWICPPRESQTSKNFHTCWKKGASHVSFAFRTGYECFDCLGGRVSQIWQPHPCTHQLDPWMRGR